MAASATAVLHFSSPPKQKQRFLFSTPKRQAVSFTALRKTTNIVTKEQCLVSKRQGQPQTLDYGLFFHDSATGEKMVPAAQAASVESDGETKASESTKTGGKAHTKISKKGRNVNLKSTKTVVDPYQVLKYPLMTEAALKELEVNNTLVFIVEKRADKKKIREAVENMYGVKTKRVNTLMRPDGRKKAYVMCEADVAKKIGII